MALNSFTTVGIRSELYTQSTFQNDRACAVLGTSAVWDTPTEIWTFDSSSMAVDDGITVIRPTDILDGSPGRFLFRTYFVRQFGTKYSKEWNGSITTSGNSAVFDISSAGFSSIITAFAFAVLPSGTVVNLPVVTGSASSLTSMTISLLESKTTGVLIGGNVEGLEAHAVANTVVYLNVKGN